MMNDMGNDGLEIRRQPSREAGMMVQWLEALANPRGSTVRCAYQVNRATWSDSRGYSAIIHIEQQWGHLALSQSASFRKVRGW